MPDAPVDLMAALRASVDAAKARHPVPPPPPAPPAPTHVLVVGACEECSILDDFHCLRENYRWARHSWAYTLECHSPNVEACQGFLECGVDGCPVHYRDGLVSTTDVLLDSGEEEPEFHGVEHVRINGSWMVATGRCWAHVSENLDDAASSLDIKQPGRYPVYIRDENDGDLELELAT